MDQSLRSCTAWFLLASLLTWTPLFGNPAGPDAFTETIDEIRRAHHALLKSGTCAGRLTIQRKEIGEKTLSTLVDCDFALAFDGESVRLEREYRENHLKKEDQHGAWGIEDQGFVRSVLVLRGTENYWARFDDQGQPSCFVLNRAWCQNLFRNLDSPASHPVRIWENAFDALSNVDLEFDVLPLKGQGIFARARKNNYSVECYLMPPRPLCLTRLVTKIGNAMESEYNLEWENANGVMHVKHYAMRAADRDRTQEFTCVVDYTDFQANIAVDPEQFELTSLGIRTGTKFHANAPVPAEFVYDGSKLVPTQHE